MSDHPDKPKHTPHSPLVYLGLRPTPFEFTIDESIEVCVVRLKGQDKHVEALGFVNFGFQSIHVNVRQKDTSAYSFTVARLYGRRGVPRAIGQMERLSEYSTLVKGAVQPFTKSVELFTLCAFMALVLGICSSNIIIVGFTVYFDIVMLLVFVKTGHDAKTLIRLIQETVSHSKGLDVEK